MSMYKQIQQLLIQYCGESIDLAKFREEFVPILVAVNESEPEDFRLAGKVEALCGQMSEGFIGERELRKSLAKLLPMVVVNTEITFRLQPRNSSPAHGESGNVVSGHISSTSSPATQPELPQVFKVAVGN